MKTNTYFCTLLFSCSYEFLTSCFSNTAFKKLTNVRGMSDYFENLNLRKTTCFEEFKSGTVININHNFVSVIITKFSKRHFCGQSIKRCKGLIHLLYIYMTVPLSYFYTDKRGKMNKSKIPLK